MSSLFVDCPTGLAGDMILAGLLDLGVPRKVVEAPLSTLGLGNAYALKVEEDRSLGLRGQRVSVDGLELELPERRWQEVKTMIMEAPLQESLQRKVLAVFKTLAECEASVHGHSVDCVHFHELGAIDALVDVVGVCAAFEYLSPNQVFCTPPPAGYGSVSTSHGVLPVPVPAVVELARRHQISLSGLQSIQAGELTTPTGLALMAILADSFGQPSSLSIRAIGVGLGHRTLDRPNFLRILEIDDLFPDDSDKGIDGLRWQPLVVQEAWVDDATPEEVAVLIDQLRQFGALDVVCQQVQMKKSRQGMSLIAIVSPENAGTLRSVWLSKGTTLGLRERSEGRWVLPRRLGSCSTSWGNVAVKQAQRPDGRFTLKPEHDDLLRLSIASGQSLEVLRGEVFLASADFVAEEDWSW